MKLRNFGLLLALVWMGCATWPAQGASSRVVATVTVTNAPTTNGMTFQANADIRTWTNSTTASPSITILTNAAIGGVTTNLWNQIVTYPYADSLLPVWKATNQLELWAKVDSGLTITITGPWASVTYTTNPVTPQKLVRAPIASEPTATTAQKIASDLVSDMSTLSTNTFAQTSTALANHVNLSQAQTVGNKTYTNALINASTLTNVTVKTMKMGFDGTNPNGYEFFDSLGARQSTIAPDAFGFPTIYSTIVSEVPSVSLGHVLYDTLAIATYAQLAAGNAFTGTNSFAMITNSLIAGSTISNTVSKGTLEIDESFGFKETTISSLANGGNAAVPIGTASWIRLTAGPTAAFSLDGIANGGKRDVFIFNDTGQDMTVNHESGTDPVSTNRIVTMNGSTRATTGNGVVHLKYSTSKSRWVLVGIEQ